MRIIEKWAVKLAARFLTFLIEHYFGFRCTDAENLPHKGPAIIVANHQSYLDIPLLATLFKGRGILDEIYWVIAKSVYHNPSLHWFVKAWNIIVVNGTIKKASDALARNNILMIFPEGVYHWHKVQAIKEGRQVPEIKIGNSTAILGLKTGCPIIPVYIQGTEKALPPYGMIPKPVQLSLTFGTAFSFTPCDPEDITDELIADKARLVLQKIMDLAPR